MIFSLVHIFQVSQEVLVIVACARAMGNSQSIGFEEGVFFGASDPYARVDTQRGSWVFHN
jgi:hypothetical protein